MQLARDRHHIIIALTMLVRLATRTVYLCKFRSNRVTCKSHDGDFEITCNNPFARVTVEMALLHVECSNRRLEIEVRLVFDTVGILKRKVEELEGTPTKKQLLKTLDGTALCDNEAPLSNYALEGGSTLRLSVIPENHFLVAVEQAAATTSYFPIGRNDNVLELKRQIEEENGVPVEKQIILHQEREVPETTFLSNLLQGTVLMVKLELRYNLIIELHSGATFELLVPWNEPVETLDLAVNRRGRVPYHHQELMYNDQLMELGHRINEYGVTDGARITVNLRDYETMVFIKTLTGRTIVVMVGPYDTVAQVKQKIERQEEIPASHQRLIFVGEQLHDHHRLLDYRIEHESAVHLVLRSGDSYEVFVDVPNSRSHAFEVLPTDSVAYLKNKVRDREGLPLDIMDLYIGEQKLSDESVTLREVGVAAGTSLRLVVNQGRDTQIFVGLPNRDSLSLWVNRDMTIAHLKEVVAQRANIPTELQEIYFARQRLVDERTLRSYTIESNHMLHVEIVHPPTLKLTVRFPDGNNREFQIVSNQTVASLKREIEAQCSVPSTQQLFFQGLELDNSKQLQHCGISDDSVLDLSSSRPTASSTQGSSGEMHLFVKTLTGKTVTVVVNPTDTILDIKQRIMEKEGVALAHQCLICAGKQLDNSVSIQECGIQHQSVLHLVLRVPSQGPISLAVQCRGREYVVDSVNVSDTVAQLKVGQVANNKLIFVHHKHASGFTF